MVYARIFDLAHRGAMDTKSSECGTTGSYRRGCRCDVCRAANAAAAAERRARRLEQGMPADAHGMPSGYTFWGCRCKVCKRTERDRSRNKRAAKPPTNSIPDDKHGTASGYGYWRCRCEPCKRANREVAQRRRDEHRALDPDIEYRIRRYKFRIDPSPTVVRQLRRVFGSCRFVANRYIELARLTYAAEGHHVGSWDAYKIVVTEAKKDAATAWLAGVPTAPLSSAVADVGKAYDNFFASATGKRKGRKVGRPQFRKRSSKQAARFDEGAFSIRGGWQNTGRDGGRLYLSTIGTIAVNWHRPLPGYASSATIIEDRDGRWWASFVVREPVPPKFTPTRRSRTAGVDVGLSDFATIAYSDGTREKIANPRFLRVAERKLKRLQKQLSRKRRGSKNREKASRRLARAHTKVVNQRTNHARQLASKLTRENQTVVLETLNIAGMARATLAKSVNDAGWAQFIRCVEDAAERRRTNIVRVDRFFPSSQICSICTAATGSKPLNIRDFVCPSCGSHLDRDYNAAVNLKVAAGPVETENACGRDVRLRLAGANEDEAGTHPAERGENRARKRKSGRRSASGRRQFHDATATQPQRAVKIPGLTCKGGNSPASDPYSRMGSDKT